MYQSFRNLLLVTQLIFLMSRITYSQKIGGWYPTDSLLEKRMNHSGVQLDNGDILIAGGYTPTQGTGSKETLLFDIKIQKWSMSVPMNKGRAYHHLIKLKDGSIMAIGGFSERTCEILSNDYTRWAYTGSLNRRKYYGENVVLLQDGNVLVIGGYIDTSNDTTGALKECEIYNYSEGSWEVTSQLHTGRFEHTATVLRDGKVLVTGGRTIHHGEILLNTCEIFDPNTREWTYSAPMNYPRAGHSATLLSSGKVLVVGGQQKYSELYDPLTNQWVVVGPVYLATGHNKAVKLKDEEYLLLVHDIDDYITRCGWELYSLKYFESIYYKKFTRIITDQTVLKIDEYRALIAGGYETIIADGDLTLVPSNFCQIYDITFTNVKEHNDYYFLPKDFSLSCYPNPFNYSTNINVELNSSQHISLKVYNILGEEVKVIFKGKLNIGKHRFRFSLNTHSSGVYFVRMFSSREEKLIKIIYQK